MRLCFSLFHQAQNILLINRKRLNTAISAVYVNNNMILFIRQNINLFSITNMKQLKDDVDC